MIYPVCQRIHQDHELREEERERIQDERAPGELPGVAADQEHIVGEYRRHRIVKNIGNESGHIRDEMRLRAVLSLEKNDANHADCAEQHIGKEHDIDLVLLTNDASLEQRVANAGSAEEDCADIESGIMKRRHELHGAPPFPMKKEFCHR